MENKIIVNGESYIREDKICEHINDISDKAKMILLKQLEECSKSKMTTPDMLMACARVVEVLKEF